MEQVNLIDGKMFRGASDADIVTDMKNLAYYQNGTTFDDFIDWFVADVETVLGITLVVPPGTEPERATILIDEMVDKGIATRVE